MRLCDQHLGNWGKIEHCNDSISRAAIFDVIEAELVGHGDASAMGIESTVGIEVQILLPVEPFALVGDL